MYYKNENVLQLTPLSQPNSIITTSTLHNYYHFIENHLHFMYTTTITP